MEDNSNNIYYAKECKHEYIDDYIDTMFPYREGIPITYCKFCGLCKEYIAKILKDDIKNEE